MAFLYTNNEQSEKGIGKAILFTIASKELKYIGINLTKVTSLHNENCITKERNQQRHQKMKEKPILMDWQNQYYENDYTAERNLYI
jgi:hypothetical protein